MTMREERTVQSSIFDLFAAHEIGQELKAMSRWLDEQAEVVGWVAGDLGGGVKRTGRRGLSAESVLRCALLKQHRQLSYEELAFHLSDSASFQAFARLASHWYPKKSVLQQTIGSIRAETWERINRRLLEVAQTEKIECGKCVRIDSTVTSTPIHAPSDSSLLWDSVRVMVALLREGAKLAGAPALHYQDHRRVAKKRACGILRGRGQSRRARLYRDLLQVTRATLGYLDTMQAQLLEAKVYDEMFVCWCAQVDHYRPLIGQVLEQTERRIVRGEKVAAREKLVSLFEEHTDIIVKARRETLYGHKLNLSMGKSGLLLDMVIEQGNPADSERFLPMLDRHIAIYARAPLQIAADGGYASRHNLEQAKARGVEDVAFHKKRGLTIEAMVKSRWVYRRLRNFRAGIESGISCLKRAYGLGRCTWKGLRHFHAYVWSSVVAFNLALFTTLRPT
jgi:IS5 family transposase